MLSLTACISQVVLTLILLFFVVSTEAVGQTPAAPEKAIIDSSSVRPFDKLRAGSEAFDKSAVHPELRRRIVFSANTKAGSGY
jgi:hypothetical protein